MSSSEASGRRDRGWLAALLLVAVCAAVVVVYLPALSLGPVAEDLQWALKGATTPLHPESLLKPFHQHLRPAGNLFFAASVALFGGQWVAYRVVQLALVLGLAVLAWCLTRRTLALPPPGAALVVALWLSSPLSDDVVFITNQVKQVLLALGVVGVLLLREGSPTPARRLGIVGSAVLAAAAKEEWVILPALVLAQDVLLLSVSWRRALRRAAPWAAAVAAYLAAYWALVRFQAGWFYGQGPAEVAAKAVATAGALFHVLPPVPWEFGALLSDRPLGAALAVALTLAVVAFAVVRRDRRALFCLVASALAALPTLPGAGQAGRYLLLPSFFFLAACALSLREVGRTVRMSRQLDAAFVVLGVVLLAGDAVRVRADCTDWARFAAIARTLETEAAPLVRHARAGGAVVVVRGDDGGPLRRLLESPRGQLKLYFPRPDDPYGAVSLSALLSWQTYREGFVLERVETLPPGRSAVGFVHETGAFLPREFSTGSSPGGGPRLPVILVPRPWETFDPAAFP
ncbi:MAG: hypothetical protein A2Y78_12995 [Acidobacteria bacterium RBG_13_68_16]|nr:MAG: hypothetical protein A2Y78_12995 [Acidobacteria bacterium RBG_13_68_16]